MDLKLSKVILWPINPKNELRQVSFEAAGVTVISGWSQRGKSALIHIIDYCLGSSKCAIPVGRVRETVAWFGLLCHLKGSQLLLARKNPGESVQSPEMVMVQSKKVTVPKDLELQPRFSRDAVLKRLNQLAGLPSRDVIEDESGFAGPPSFRDMAAFEFQPQHIIANPHTLFFKADTSEHRERLVRSVLPYVLGALNAESLEVQAKLRIVESELRTRQLELEEAKRAAASWLPKLEHFYATARDQDLIPGAPAPEADWTPETYRSLLRPVTTNVIEEPALQVPQDATRQVIREISALNQESSRLSRVISERRRKLEKVQAIRDSAGGYIASLGDQSIRLASVGWFADKIRSHSDCPFCGQTSDGGKAKIQQLTAAGEEIAAKLAILPTSSESLEAEAVKLEREITEAKVNRRQIQERLERWNDYSRELGTLRNRRDFVQRFVGQLEILLEGIDAGSDIGPLAAEVERLIKQAEVLRSVVNEERIRKKMEKAIESISKTISQYAQILRVEHASKSWRLDTKSLTLKTDAEGERTDFLWEIGSAANWMGYHIATLLALHEHFRRVKQNPVPKFIILDQPSQAFFPEGIAAAKQTRNSKRISDDVARLRRLFSALSSAVQRTEMGLQIIVLEHADESVWKRIPYVKQVEEWRKDNALIPFSWR